MDSQQVTLVLTILDAVCAVLMVLFAVFTFISKRKVTYRENARKRVVCERLLERAQRKLNNKFRGVRWRKDEADDFPREVKRYGTELEEISRWRFVCFDPIERERRIEEAIGGLISLLANLHKTRDTVLIMDGNGVVQERTPTLRRRFESNTVVADELFRQVRDGDIDNAYMRLKDNFRTVLNQASDPFDDKDIVFVLHLEHFIQSAYSRINQDQRRALAGYELRHLTYPQFFQKPKDEEELSMFFLQYALDPPTGGKCTHVILENRLERLGFQIYLKIRGSQGNDLLDAPPSVLQFLTAPAAAARRRGARARAAAVLCVLRASDVAEGRVSSVVRYGALVELAGGAHGLVHISELAHTYVPDIAAVVRVGDRVRVRVLEVNDRGIGLSMKRAKRSYEDELLAGSDWGHPWGDDPLRPTRWVDTGTPPPSTGEVWEAGAPYRNKLQ